MRSEATSRARAEGIARIATSTANSCPVSEDPLAANSKVSASCSGCSVSNAHRMSVTGRQRTWKLTADITSCSMCSRRTLTGQRWSTSKRKWRSTTGLWAVPTSAELHQPLGGRPSEPGLQPGSLRPFARQNSAQRPSALGRVGSKIVEQVRLEGAFVKPNSAPGFGLDLANYRVLPLHRNAVFAPESAQLGLRLG